MRRRTLLRGVLGLPAAAWPLAPLLPPLLGFARPETLVQRSAEFAEIGNSIQMTLALPTLIRDNDLEALASIDSGFDTTIETTLKVWEHGTRQLVATRTIVVKLRRDPWQKNYLLRTKGSTGWIKRSFSERAEAIEAAVTLDGVKVCSASLLERGGEAGPFYFVEVLAMRNPLRVQRGGGGGTETRRGQGRDAEWFRRLVETLAGERARAEQVVHVRTNPFFLLPR
ncbi:hypothetical protein [Paraliomyxa miuraensis]|uniref:hypothetical protein n=1 Tax=Paraliomyxa miuraensis TaxID=376150 RepID=UPI00225B1D65|nr:hypothetical protein [Paraliomyxa miuraensis]MCX4240732.1 hypothetical protein [Paraliomyxa miuraensis]